MMCFTSCIGLLIHATTDHDGSFRPTFTPFRSEHVLLQIPFKWSDVTQETWCIDMTCGGLTFIAMQSKLIRKALIWKFMVCLLAPVL